MTEHRITTPHGTVAVVDYDGGGPDVLLLPGGGGTLADWAPVRPYLRGRRVVAIDFRWNGLSSDEGDVSLEANADDAEAIIDALGLDNPAIPDTRSAAWSRPSTRHDTRAVPVSPNLDGHGRAPPTSTRGSAPRGLTRDLKALEAERPKVRVRTLDATHEVLYEMPDEVARDILSLTP